MTTKNNKDGELPLKNAISKAVSKENDGNSDDFDDAEFRLDVRERFMTLMSDYFKDDVPGIASMSGLPYNTVRNFTLGKGRIASPFQLWLHNQGVNINWLVSGQGHMKRDSLHVTASEIVFRDFDIDLHMLILRCIFETVSDCYPDVPISAKLGDLYTTITDMIARGLLKPKETNIKKIVTNVIINN